MNALVGLPRIEPAEAQLRGDLLAALNGVEVEGALLTAALPAQAPRLNWFVCPRDLAFAIDRLGDEMLHLNAADGVRAAECLTRAEPLLRAIEWALDVELEPERLADQPPTGERLWLRIEAGSRDRVYLAVPTDMHVIAAPAAFAPRLLDDVPFATRLTIAGPRVAPMDAADLAPGDLLLLGEGPLGASLAFLDRAPVAGLFDPAKRRFTPSDAIQE
jgi:hypothetical protein